MPACWNSLTPESRGAGRWARWVLLAAWLALRHSSFRRCFLCRRPVLAYLPAYRGIPQAFAASARPTANHHEAFCPGRAEGPENGGQQIGPWPGEIIACLMERGRFRGDPLAGFDWGGGREPPASWSGGCGTSAQGPASRFQAAISSARVVGKSKLGARRAARCASRAHELVGNQFYFAPTGSGAGRAFYDGETDADFAKLILATRPRRKIRKMGLRRMPPSLAAPASSNTTPNSCSPCDPQLRLGGWGVADG